MVICGNYREKDNDVKLMELYGTQEGGLSFEQRSNIEKFIRNTAKDISIDIPNAVFLVLAAYKNENLTKPHHSDTKSWNQYNDLIEYSVDQLSKFRGYDGDWRLTIPMKFDVE